MYLLQGWRDIEQQGSKKGPQTHGLFCFYAFLSPSSSHPMTRNTQPQGMKNEFILVHIYMPALPFLDMHMLSLVLHLEIFLLDKEHIDTGDLPKEHTSPESVLCLVKNLYFSFRRSE